MENYASLGAGSERFEAPGTSDIESTWEHLTAETILASEPFLSLLEAGCKNNTATYISDGRNNENSNLSGALALSAHLNASENPGITRSDVLSPRSMFDADYEADSHVVCPEKPRNGCHSADRACTYEEVGGNSGSEGNSNRSCSSSSLGHYSNAILETDSSARTSENASVYSSSSTNESELEGDEVQGDKEEEAAGHQAALKEDVIRQLERVRGGNLDSENGLEMGKVPELAGGVPQLITRVVKKPRVDMDPASALMKDVRTTLKEVLNYAAKDECCKLLTMDFKRFESHAYSAQLEAAKKTQNSALSTMKKRSMRLAMHHCLKRIHSAIGIEGEYESFERILHRTRNKAFSKGSAKSCRQGILKHLIANCVLCSERIEALFVAVHKAELEVKKEAKKRRSNQGKARDWFRRFVRIEVAERSILWEIPILKKGETCDQAQELAIQFVELYNTWLVTKEDPEVGDKLENNT